MKVVKKENRIIIDLGRNEYYQLLEAVELGTAWVDENGYSKVEEGFKKLQEKLKNVKPIN